MKRLMIVVAFLLLAGVGGAQVSMIPKGGGGGGASTITSGSTATSGCLDGAPLKSASNVVTCTKMDQTKFVTADQSDVTAAFVDVTDLGFSVAANTVYMFECAFVATTASNTTGIQIAFNGPASPTNFNYGGSASTTSAAVAWPTGTTYDSTNGLPLASQTAFNNPHRYAGTLENGANAGTFIPRLRTEIGASAVTILRGSWCRVWTP